MGYELNTHSVPRLETYLWAYKAFLIAHLPEALDAERIFWAAAPYNDDIPLPPIPDKEWHFGNIPNDVLPYVVGTLPAATIEATVVRPDRGDMLAIIDSLVVEVYVQDNDTERAAKLAYRYCHAVAMVLSSGNPVGLDDPIKYAGRQSVDVTPTDVVTGRNAYIKGGRCALPLQIAAEL